MLVQECRHAYERLPSEAQYRLRQRCAEHKAVRTGSKAFLHAIHSITGQDSPQQAHTEGVHIPLRACMSEMWTQPRLPSLYVHDVAAPLSHHGACTGARSRALVTACTQAPPVSERILISDTSHRRLLGMQALTAQARLSSYQHINQIVRSRPSMSLVPLTGTCR